MAPNTSSGSAQTCSSETFPSIVEIKAAIPGHCFKPDLLTSFYYVLKDVILVCVVYALMFYLERTLPWHTFIVLWPLYYFVQGTNLTAIFVLGHDCGHDSFSRYDVVNDVMGNLLHAFLLTPFYPWKLSHRNHHKNTGNFDKDEVFYPKRESEYDGGQHVELFGLGFAWYVYLVLGYSPRTICHFNPYTDMFLKHVTACYISILLDAGWAYCLYYYASVFGVMSLINYYFIPLTVFATYMVVITFLHHTDVNVPWFSDDTWSFVKGQLSSIDRHYGFVHGWIHNIGTHQIHHLFTKVPHYHLQEATAHFRKAFPELVRVKDDPIFPTYVKMFRKFTKQFVISDDTKVHVFK